jgi:dienelactone hydrolase
MEASAGIGAEAGNGALAGMEASAGSGAAGSGAAGTGGPATECCSDGDCLCRDAPPSALTSNKGKYKFATFNATKGTVYYPTDATPPFAAVAVCGGFTNTGPEMNPWGEFYASHGIVTIITSTLGSDQPATRATKLLAAIAELKSENDKSGGMLFGKLAGRYGTSGYSMGGGGTTIASGDDSTLKTSVGLAPWGPDGSGVQVPTLLLCGGSDTTAPCSMTDNAYSAIPAGTPKMKISINGTSHLAWFGPTQAGMGTSGAYALAFQKVFLEGDERWKSLLLGKPSNGTATTNIQ